MKAINIILIFVSFIVMGIGVVLVCIDSEYGDEDAGVGGGVCIAIAIILLFGDIYGMVKNTSPDTKTSIVLMCPYCDVKLVGHAFDETVTPRALEETCWIKVYCPECKAEFNAEALRTYSTTGKLIEIKTDFFN